MTSSGTHEFIVVGGNFAGISAAHYILRHTIRLLSELNSSAKYHLTLVSPSSHFFWKVGSPRTLASPDLIPFEKAFLPIAEGFKEYTPEQYSFVQGTAVGLDPEKKLLTITDESDSTTVKTTSHSTDIATRTLHYSTLVLATGTTSASALWTLHGSHQKSVQAMEELHNTLPTAKTILVAGGGPAGVETTGELAYLYQEAKTTILSGSTKLLTRLKTRQSSDAEFQLEQLGVEVIHNVQVKSTNKIEGGKQTQVNLNDGSTRVVDVYIDATGGKPNTSFLPKSWLNERGYILVDSKTMRLDVPKENPMGGYHVYAVGDVASYSLGGLMDVNDAIAPLCSSILIDLVPASKESETSEENASFIASWRAPASSQLQQKYFKQTLDTQMVPIGQKGGVGLLFGWRAPGLLVWGIKGRLGANYMISWAPGILAGDKYVKP